MCLVLSLCTVCEEWQWSVDHCWSTDAFNICWPPTRDYLVVLVVKNPPAKAGDTRDMDSIPGLGWSPGEGCGNPLQYSCLKNPMDRRAWWATIPEVIKSWTRLSSRAHTASTEWPCPGTQRWIRHSHPPERPQFPRGSMPDTSPLTVWDRDFRLRFRAHLWSSAPGLHPACVCHPRCHRCMSLSIIAICSPSFRKSFIQGLSALSKSCGDDGKQVLEFIKWERYSFTKRRDERETK